MKRVYAENPGVKKEQDRLKKNGIENVPTGNIRNVLNNRRGGAGGRR